MTNISLNTKSSFILLTLILFSLNSFAQKLNMNELNKDIKNTDVMIQVTKKKMKEIGDVSFLPDLYFVLADLYHEKSRLTFEEAKLKQPQKKIEDLDNTASKKAKKLAIESYYRFTENYPKDDRVDKAFYNIALSYRELGQIEDMVNIYKKITKEFPKSKYWEESQLRLGDYFFEVKKEYELAIEIYQKILDRETNEYMALAQYKMGWCYINLNKFPEALQAFESLLVIDKSRSVASVSVAANPDIDIRRDALLSMIWPYSEIEKLPADKQNATQFFEKQSHDKVTLIQVLNRLGQRLTLKNKPEQAGQITQVYARLIEVQYELDGRVKSINQFYESYKKNKKPFPLQKITEITLETANELKNASYVSAKDKSNNLGNLEIYSRDFITELNRLALANRSLEGFNQVAEHYENYLQIFPKNKYSTDMRTNLAEVQFVTKNSIKLA
jgi:tetratricopeptide (TPR) repeat protein